MPEQRRRGVKDETEGKEGVIGGFTPDVIGERSPEKAAGDVEQAEQSSKSRGEGRDLTFFLHGQLGKGLIDSDEFAAENFLQHR